MIESVLVSLDRLTAPTLWLFAQPPYYSLTALGLIICAALITCGLALVTLPLGRKLSPLWVLAMLMPLAPVILLWILAYKQWPVAAEREL